MGALALLLVAAAPAPGGQVERVDLASLMKRAKHSPRVKEARATAKSAEARRKEVARSWWPSIEITAFGGPTDVDFSGGFYRVDARVVMPLYTFGKLDAGKRASSAAANAYEAQAEASANDVTVDCARSFYAVKIGRELVAMLEEGREVVADELAKVEDRLERGTGESTETDRYRLSSLLAEIDARLSEARKVQDYGLAGMRYLWGSEAVDVDDSEFLPLEFDIGTREEARATALRNRPELRAAKENVKANRGLVDLERARWWPDIILIGSGVASDSTDDVTSSFLNDLLRGSGFGAGVYLRWNIETGARPARIEAARADASRAEATLEYATKGVQMEAEMAWADARDARERLAAAERGEQQARAWLVATTQADLVGLADGRDLWDSMFNWFSMRARRLQATYDWNVAVVSFARATGQTVDPGKVREDD